MSESTLAVRDWNGTQVPAAGTYTLDVAHTHVGFAVKHMMVSKVRGSFHEFTGTIVVAEDPLRTSVTAEIAMASVQTGQQGRDEHLRTGDFFEAEKYPSMTFRSTGLTQTGEDTFTIAGELTIKGVSRPVELATELSGVAQGPSGQQVVGFSATTQINREDFGLTYNQALETGGVMIGKLVRIEIEGEATLSA